MRVTNKKIWLTSQIHQQILDGKYEICRELSCGDVPKWNFSTEFYGRVPELRQDYVDSALYAYEALEAVREYCKNDVVTTQQFCETLDILFKNTEEKEMSVIITKHGDPNTSREFKCRNCGCEFMVTKQGYNNTLDDPLVLMSTCPECDIYVPAMVSTKLQRGRHAFTKPVDEVSVTYSESEDMLDEETFDDFNV